MSKPNPIAPILRGARTVLEEPTFPKQPDDQAELLYEIDTMTARLKEIRERVAADLITEVKAQRGVTQFGAYTIEVMARQDRKEWDHATIATEIAERVAPKTPKANAKVVEAITDCAGIGYWRITELRRYGIEADLHCKKVSAVPTVTAHPAENPEPFLEKAEPKKARKRAAKKPAA